MKEAKLLTECLSYEEYLRLTRERRILVLPSSDELIDRAVSEILQRVQRIDVCCSADYADTIHDIWSCVCETPSIRYRLVMNNGRHKNEPNWYFVANILSVMASRGVYEGSLRALVGRMHGGKTSYANNAMRPSYQMTEAEESSLKTILRQCVKCLK